MSDTKATPQPIVFETVARPDPKALAPVREPGEWGKLVDAIVATATSDAQVVRMAVPIGVQEIQKHPRLADAENRVRRQGAAEPRWTVRVPLGGAARAEAEEEEAVRKPRRSAPLPLVLVHVRITGVGVPLADTEPLRDAILGLMTQYADRYALRVKRRIVDRERGAELHARYEARVALHAMIE